ncbi:MAG TPA: PSD1 and planctomycete cytochrome C domain-containing protein [Planctomycetota bacterium]|nr:PSD1 and planctomycete cytochrome C domain-containing protein [Planctomycetota bacterium]
MTHRAPQTAPTVGVALLGALTLLGAWVAPESSASLPPVRYGRDIRPILSDRCFRCHGPDEAQRRADLRLDGFEGATAPRADGAAIVPGDARASELWRRVTSDDPDEAMPPEESHKARLSADELALVRRWIDAGAEYEPHWAFVPPTRPTVPDVDADGWARNAIDAFVLERLEREGLEPAPEAPREVLLRRVFLDLTGLPPTPEELDAFLADDAPDAYERQVARLLSEEPYVSRYAERMAQPWLDAARYADTCGIHMDAGRQIWPWRDWVLHALRENMPFDRFLTEQLAGDLLPEATDAQRVASGFNRNHVTTDEGGAISEEYLVEYAVDRAATTGSVFLGLTLGCARCHDHKYDPVSQEEFFSFYAYFNSIEEPGLYSQLPDPQRAFEPFMTVPTPEQRAQVAELEARLLAAREELAAPAPGEDAQRAEFLEGQRAANGVRWVASEFAEARSTGGAEFAMQPDGSLLVLGANPDRDEHVVALTTDATDLRLVLLEALTDASLGDERVGRAFNGNAVLTGLRAEAISLGDPSLRRELRFGWAWADFEQQNGDHRVVNALSDDALGWAVDAHNRPGPRAALFLADEPFGYEGGTRLEVHLDYDSEYAQHVFGRVRLSLATLAPEGLDALPAAVSGWYATAPFSAPDGEAAYTTAFGPESMGELDLERAFGDEGLRFNFIPEFQDERLNSELAGGVNATYVARRVFAPSRRSVEVALGSDDGFRLFLDGAEVAGEQVERALDADQDRVTLELAPGVHTLVLKVVNTGGPAGFYWRAERRADELAGDLAAALLPDVARWPELDERLRAAWRLAFSPSFRAGVERVSELEGEFAEVQAAVPQTMVMRELAEPRATFVLTRGQYDKPDASRPVRRGVPAALGALAADAPADRLGLARWMVAPQNPLVARVAVNRLWEQCFGNGLVRTSEDFGLQGEWPSHAELLDWLAVEFREGGWDVRALLTEVVTSSTYRQSSRARPELGEIDPDNRLLASFPRRRLSAEQLRDQALYVSGLLVESLGGPSVKPYQPAGLWAEVAMPGSNTKLYEQGLGDDLWRRSLYTYWKRAAPPPAMLTFDAPTREYCTIRRTATNTPLQALVLWNDPQFVEAARVLAERVLQAAGDDRARLTQLVRRCTGRAPDARQLALLEETLEAFRARYRAAPQEAAALVEVGERPAAALDVVELAAWTLVASAVLDIDATVTQG